jgi:hypothetical protein
MLHRNIICKPLQYSLLHVNFLQQNKKKYIQNCIKNKQSNYNKVISRKTHNYSQPLFRSPGGGNGPNGPSKMMAVTLLSAFGVYISRKYNEPRPTSFP